MFIFSSSDVLCRNGQSENYKALNKGYSNFFLNIFFYTSFQAIHSMQEKGMESDPRYGQLLALARNAQHAQQQISPGFASDLNGPLGNSLNIPSQQSMGMTHENLGEEHSSLQGSIPAQNSGFSGDQISQLRNQIMAYKLLSHNQPLSDQIKMAVQSKAASSRMPNMSSSQGGRPGNLT